MYVHMFIHIYIYIYICVCVCVCGQIADLLTGFGDKDLEEEPGDGHEEGREAAKDVKEVPEGV
jgi:hypothetical protein